MQSTFDHPTPHDDAPKPNFWLTAAKFIALATVAALCLTYGGFIIAAVAKVTGLVALPLVTSIANLEFGWMAVCVATLFGFAGLSIYQGITTVRHYNESKSLEMAVESPTNTATDVATAEPVAASVRVPEAAASTTPQTGVDSSLDVPESDRSDVVAPVRTVIQRRLVGATTLTEHSVFPQPELNAQTDEATHKVTDPSAVTP